MVDNHVCACSIRLSRLTHMSEKHAHLGERSIDSNCLVPVTVRNVVRLDTEGRRCHGHAGGVLNMFPMTHFYQTSQKPDGPIKKFELLKTYGALLRRYGHTAEETRQLSCKQLEALIARYL